MLNHNDLFTFTTLTNAINKLPNAPEDLGRWFKWHAQGITTLTATIEERDGVIGLVQFQPRGAAPQSVRRDTRRAKAIPVPHYPLYDSVLATEVQSVRAFGSDNEMETVAGAIEDKQIAMRRDMETTHEYQRAGALNGLLLDADGTVIADWYDFFKKPKTTHVIDLSNPNTDVRSEIIKAVQKGERALGNLRPRRWKWIQGQDFHLDCIGHASVKASYDRWNDGAALREDLREAGFMLASNVEVISYHRGYIVTPNGEVRFSGEIPWELARELTVDDEIRVAGRYISGAALVGKVLDLELSADGDGNRVASFTIGCVPGTGQAALPPDDEFDEQTDDLIYKVSGKSASTPVNAMALRIATPRVSEWSNQGASQLAAMFVADDPEAALSTRATQLVVGYDALRQEDLLSRRLRVTCRPLALPRQIDLEAEA